jgi:hypothetical protein
LLLMKTMRLDSHVGACVINLAAQAMRILHMLVQNNFLSQNPLRSAISLLGSSIGCARKRDRSEMIEVSLNEHAGCDSSCRVEWKKATRCNQRRGIYAMPTSEKAATLHRMTTLRTKR